MDEESGESTGEGEVAGVGRDESELEKLNEYISPCRKR